MSSYDDSIRSISILITMIIGWFIVLEYFVKAPVINNFAGTISGISTCLLATFTIIGVGNLSRHHVKNIMKQGKNWMPSVVLIVSCWVPLVIGLAGTRKDPIFAYLYSSLYLPTSQAFFGILSFYILSAAYRTFKTRSLDSTVLLLAAIFVMLGNAPATSIIWSGFSPLGGWILDVCTAAGVRGISIGIAIGSVVTALRVLTGRERRHLAGRE